MNYRSICLVAAFGWTLAGCSDSLYEDSTGSVDLVPFYGGGTAADPTAGLPRQIVTNRGWVNGHRIEYWDFGSITLPRKTGSRAEPLRVPDAPEVSRMYFFYDQLGRPLFSTPGFDPKTNTWFMPGGKGAQNPAPVESTGDAYYEQPYAGRPRAKLIDPERGVADYQRPIIDVLPGADYSGLWEVVEITIKDSDYTVDDVKSLARLQEALDDGRASQHRTGFVINCPLVDERTAVVPSAMNDNIPRPRLELWYRTKLANCFLANGWQSIGETKDANVAASERSNLRLFDAGEYPANRINTLDVISARIGDETTLTAPVAKSFTPTLPSTTNAPDGTKVRARIVNDDVFTALPRVTAADPAGYSPITWVWDTNIPEGGPPYVPGSRRDADDLMVPPDPSPAANPTLGGTVEARDGGTNVVSRNLAIVGPATSCTSNDQCKFGLQCNVMPDVTIATTDPPAGQNIADVVIQREGGPRCDVPAGGFGASCSPGVSRCDVQSAADSPNETQLKAIGVATAGPSFTVHADKTTADKRLADAQTASTDTTLTQDERDDAAAMIPSLQMAADRAGARVEYYDRLGFTTDLNGWGYLCYPGFTSNGFGTGFCAIRCDATANGTVTEVETEIDVNGTKVPYTFRTEPRCGGTNMLGYRCLPSGTVPERQRVCVRECNRQASTMAAYFVDDPAPTNAFNTALCNFPFNIAGANMTPMPIKPSDDLREMKAITGQECLAASLSVSALNSTTVRACTWNPDMVPRNPDIWPGQP